MDKDTAQRVIEYIGKAEYDSGGQWIVGRQKDGELQRLADIRGWGAIQYMFANTKDAEMFQDAVGRFITEAINEKIERVKAENDNLYRPLTKFCDYYHEGNCDCVGEFCQSKM